MRFDQLGSATRQHDISRRQISETKKDEAITKMQNWRFEKENQYLKPNPKNAKRLNMTPLHVAARLDHPNCLKAMVKKFPHLVDSQNMYGETALFIACRFGRLHEILE